MDWNKERNLTMLVDFYELTMANGYLQMGMQNKRGVFDMFFRKIPDHGGFAIAAGLEQVIEKLIADSMSLMYESFSGTAEVEGVAVAAQVLKHIRHMQCFCVYSTHIHEVVLFMDDLNRKKQVVAPMCVGMESGVRTFKILFGKTDELSHAYDIAKKYGLEFPEEEEE